MKENINTSPVEKAAPGQYLSFVLNGQGYGVPIGTVREINRVTEITKVPQTADFVAGVINLRGKVIPVVDLRLKFKLKYTPYTKQTCIIVIEGKEGQIGMIVDAISGVLDLSAEQIEPSPSLGNKEDLNFVLGMGKVDNAVVILVDIVNVLSSEQLSGIITAMTAEGMDEKKAA